MSRDSAAGLLGLVGITLAQAGQAQEEAEVEAPTVVVTGTRVEQKSFVSPMAIDAIHAISQQKIQGEGKPLANI